MIKRNRPDLAAKIGYEINKILAANDVNELYITGFDDVTQNFGVFIYGSPKKVEIFLQKAKERLIQQGDVN